LSISGDARKTKQARTEKKGNGASERNAFRNDDLRIEFTGVEKRTPERK
jgi:hypothetical protein